MDSKAADAQKRLEFAERLNSACDMHPHVPPKFKGRQSWVRDALKKQFDVELTPETLSRWFNGEAKPRPTTLAQIAQLLKVDVAWLSLGAEPQMTIRERRVRNAMADGAVNLVAGMLQIDGAAVAFPDDTESSGVDIQAIIRGASYQFHIVLGEPIEGEYRFVIPPEAEDHFKIGVVRYEGFDFRLFELRNEAFAAEGAWAGTVSAQMDAEQLEKSEIHTFAERL